MRSSLLSIVLFVSAFTSTVTAIASPASSTSKKASKVNAASENNPDDPTGKILYITEPACGFYRCTVTWSIGQEVAVNWLGPPGGNVAVSLMSNIGGPTYPITNSIAGTSQEGYCDAGYGLGVVAPGHECGRVQFVVPDGWEKMNNYTIVVQSLDNPDQIGYTDMITIAAPNSSSNANIPTGTSVSLATIAAPTSTNYGASTKASISVPSPTAVTGQSTSSASSTTSSGLVSSRSSSANSRAQSSSTLSTPSAASAGSQPSASSTQTPSSAALTSYALKSNAAFFVAAFVALCCL